MGLSTLNKGPGAIHTMDMFPLNLKILFPRNLRI